MKIKKYQDANNNSDFLFKQLQEVQNRVGNCIWMISDLDLAPKFEGDYSGTGAVEKDNISYGFVERVSKEKLVFISFKELEVILEQTRTVYLGVFVCFKDTFDTKKCTVVPTVEGKNREQASYKEALYEMRVLDGDLFYLFENE